MVLESIDIQGLVLNQSHLRLSQHFIVSNELPMLLGLEFQLSD